MYLVVLTRQTSVFTAINKLQSLHEAKLGIFRLLTDFPPGVFVKLNKSLLSLFAAVCLAASALSGCGNATGTPDVVNDVADTINPDTSVSDDGVADVADSTVRDVAGDSVTVDVSDVEDGYQQELPAEICRTGSMWNVNNTTARVFTDVTATSGLKDLGVAGVRVGTVDFDNDGLPDLVTRNVAQTRDSFEAGGARYTWLLRNTGAFKFEDVTESSGLTATRDGGNVQGRISHVVVWGDVDNDGDLDAFSGRFVSTTPETDNGDRAELLINNGNGTFTLGAPTDFQHPGGYDPTMGGSFLDYDRDGKLDIFVGYGAQGPNVYQDRLYKGNGAGGFTDVTEEAGLKQAMIFSVPDANYKNGKSVRNTWGTTVADLNNDGWPDIMCSVYGRYFNALWLGGPGGFTDWSIESGYASDDREDWTTNLNAQCYCKLNPTAEGCDTCPEPPNYFGCSGTLRWNHVQDRQSYRLGGNTFSTVAGDVDNDGDMDLFNFEIVHWDVGDTSDPAELLMNDGAATPTFARPGNDMMGFVRDWDGNIDWNAGDMTGAMFDFDNDGRLDVLIASSDYPYTRAFLYHQKTDGKFEEVPVDVGIDHPHAHGVAVADYDLDGDLDVVLGHSTARCSSSPEECYPTQEVHVFRNDLGQNGNWLRVNLVGGEGSNRAAIGAVVKVVTGDVTQMREVGGGHGHVGMQHEMTQHFGLGDACNAEKVIVRWPDSAGTVEVFKNVRGNYLITIEQGKGVIEYVSP